MRCEEFIRLIDGYLDDELDEACREQMLEHARTCGACRDALRSAEQIRDLLSGMDDNVSVPLPAQAAWRSAIRKESANARRRRVFVRAASGIAAALVVGLGVTMAVRGGGLGQVRIAASDSVVHTELTEAAPDETEAEGDFPVLMATALVESDGGQTRAAKSKQADALGAAGNAAEESAFPDAEEEAPMSEAVFESNAMPLSEECAEDMLGVAASRNRMLARTYIRSLETEDFEEAYTRISDLITEYDGYYVSRTVQTDENGCQVCRMVAAVPANDADEFLSAVSRAGTLVLQQDKATDIARSYSDAEERLAKLNEQKQELLETLADAERSDEANAELELLLDDIYRAIVAEENYLSECQTQLDDVQVSIDLSEVQK